MIPLDLLEFINKPKSAHTFKQKGATLAVTLILLFVVTLLGTSAIMVTQMQEKMSSNLQDKELSFNAAESALAAGEAWLLGLTSQPFVFSSCTSYPCIHTLYQNIDFKEQSQSWWATNSTEYSTTLKNIATQPRFIIEFVEYLPDTPIVGSSISKSQGVFYYQITARGTGASDSAVSILQTTVGRRF